MKTGAKYQSAIESFGVLLKEIEAARAQSKDKATGAALGRLALCLDYVQRDLALQKDRLERADVEERNARVREMEKFIHAHAGDGVFLPKQ